MDEEYEDARFYINCDNTDVQNQAQDDVIDAVEAMGEDQCSDSMDYLNTRKYGDTYIIGGHQMKVTRARSPVSGAELTVTVH